MTDENLHYSQDIIEWCRFPFGHYYHTTGEFQKSRILPFLVLIGILAALFEYTRVLTYFGDGLWR